jgi:hypothetical protein
VKFIAFVIMMSVIACGAGGFYTLLDSREWKEIIKGAIFLIVAIGLIFMLCFIPILREALPGNA